MRKRKGFTLIELLAVIVILAVIALITTPIIIGIIEDNGTTLKLILDRNLTEKTHWNNEQSSMDELLKPKTAMNLLNTATISWTNIAYHNYCYMTYNDYGLMTSVTITNVRAEMPSYQQLSALGCYVDGLCSSTWLYGNMTSNDGGYWTTTSYQQSFPYAYYMFYLGGVRVGDKTATSGKVGVRPVIELTKTQIG